MPGSLSALESLAGEFGLGQVRDAVPITGHRDVVRLAAGDGVFLVRPAGPADPALYEQVALRLARAGIRQAMPLRTTAGALVSESGLVVQEFLPGTAYLSPSRTQTLATMRHITAYHAVLRSVPVPAMAESVWTRVTEPAYLLAELPRLCHGDNVAGRALELLTDALPQISALPRQLVHGDIGPDNVLMDGADVVAIIDFTPHHQPALFAVATAIYWYHVHGHDDPDPAAIGASLDPAAIGASLDAAGPWTGAERAAWPAMLLLEALRRLATPLAIAAESAHAPAAASAHAQTSAQAALLSRRHTAVAAIVRTWPALAAIGLSRCTGASGP